MVAFFEQLCQEQPEWEQYWQQLRTAEHLSTIVWIALQMGLFIARRVVEAELGQRAAAATVWGNCPECGTRLQSKGWQSRSLQTLVGKIG